MKSSSYGTITLKKSFYMKLDLTWHGLTREAANRDYEGIMRIGNPSSVVKDCSGHATRYPALYLDRERKAIQFSLSNDIDCWGVGLLNVSLTDLQIDSVYTLIIQYNQSWIYIQANDQILYDEELTMYPTPGPSVAPSQQPTRSPTLKPTRKPTPLPTTTTLPPTPHPTEPVDFFATNIKIYAEYFVPPHEQSKMYLVDEDDIESMVLDIFPPCNITMNSVNIDNHHDSINLNMIVSVNTNSELN